MPRFGAAYQLDDKTVIRGGVGQFYAPVWDDPGKHLAFHWAPIW
jgi:hypothetical protein